MANTVKVTNKVNWVSSVMNILGMDEEGKVGQMQNALAKMLKKQIKTRKNEIAKLEAQTAEKLEEMDEILVERNEEADLAFITVDVDRIKSVDDRKEYAQILNSKFDRALETVESYEEEIKDLKERTKATIDTKKKEIARFELKLSKIS